MRAMDWFVPIAVLLVGTPVAFVVHALITLLGRLLQAL
jgi:hypothetical protein